MMVLLLPQILPAVIFCMETDLGQDPVLKTRQTSVYISTFYKSLYSLTC